MTCSKIHATLFYDDIRILLATYFNLNVCREITYYTYSVLERVFDTFHIIYIYIYRIYTYIYIFTIIYYMLYGDRLLELPYSSMTQWWNLLSKQNLEAPAEPSMTADVRHIGRVAPTNWDRQRETYNNLTGELFHQFWLQVLQKLTEATCVPGGLVCPKRKLIFDSNLGVSRALFSF